MGDWAWKTQHVTDFRRQWRKVHHSIDAMIPDQAIEVTDNTTGDSHMLQCLLDKVDLSQAIAG